VRRGFNLVEVMVGLALGMVLLSVVQNIFFKGTSLLESSHGHLEASAGAQLLVERIHADLRRVAPGDAFTQGGSGPPMSLDIVDPGGGVGSVSYDLVAGPTDDTFYVQRNGVTLRSVVLKELDIQAVTVAGGSGGIFGVVTTLVASDSSGRKEFPLADFTAIDVHTKPALDPYWVPNGS
jgi:hypothetical protein